MLGFKAHRPAGQAGAPPLADPRTWLRVRGLNTRPTRHRGCCRGITASPKSPRWEEPSRTPIPEPYTPHHGGCTHPAGPGSPHSPANSGLGQEAAPHGLPLAGASPSPHPAAEDPQPCTSSILGAWSPAPPTPWLQGQGGDIRGVPPLPWGGSHPSASSRGLSSAGPSPQRHGFSAVTARGRHRGAALPCCQGSQLPQPASCWSPGAKPAPIPCQLHSSLGIHAGSELPGAAAGPRGGHGAAAGREETPQRKPEGPTLKKCR